MISLKNDSSDINSKLNLFPECFIVEENVTCFKQL